jgi:hypothetical protein
MPDQPVNKPTFCPTSNGERSGAAHMKPAHGKFVEQLTFYFAYARTYVLVPQRIVNILLSLNKGPRVTTISLKLRLPLQSGYNARPRKYRAQALLERNKELIWLRAPCTKTHPIKHVQNETLFSLTQSQGTEP